MLANERQFIVVVVVGDGGATATVYFAFVCFHKPSELVMF